MFDEKKILGVSLVATLASAAVLLINNLKRDQKDAGYKEGWDECYEIYGTKNTDPDE